MAEMARSSQTQQMGLQQVRLFFNYPNSSQKFKTVFKLKVDNHKIGYRKSKTMLKI